MPLVALSAITAPVCVCILCRFESCGGRAGEGKIRDPGVSSHPSIVLTLIPPDVSVEGEEFSRVAG